MKNTLKPYVEANESFASNSERWQKRQLIIRKSRKVERISERKTKKISVLLRKKRDFLEIQTQIVFLYTYIIMFCYCRFVRFLIIRAVMFTFYPYLSYSPRTQRSNKSLPEKTPNRKKVGHL